MFEDEFYPNSYFYKKLFYNNQNILFEDYNRFEIKTLNLLEYKLYINYETLKKFIDYYSELVSPKVFNKVSIQVKESEFFNKKSTQNIKNISKIIKNSNSELEITLDDTMKNQVIFDMFKKFCQHEKCVEYFLLYELIIEYQESTTQKERKSLLDQFFNDFTEKYPKIKLLIPKENFDQIAKELDENDNLNPNLLNQILLIFQNLLEMKFELFKKTKEFQNDFLSNSKISIPQMKMKKKKRKSRATSLIQNATKSPSIKNSSSFGDTISQSNSPTDKILRKTNPLHMLDLFGIFKKNKTNK